MVYFATIHPELGPSVCCLIDSVKDTPSSFTQLSFSNTCADVGSGSTLLLWSTLCLFYLFVTSFFFSPAIVFFLTGTNVTEAKRILTESGLPITAAENLDDAARKAVAAIKKE